MEGKKIPDLAGALNTQIGWRRHLELVLPREHIKGLESIREIYFENAWLANMMDISNLISLRKFVIGLNLITEIPASFLKGLPNMKIFACNNNKLKSLPNISAFFPQLEELYVHGNHLKTLSDLFEFPSLAILQAAENPYECYMPMCWLRMLPWWKASVNYLQDNPVCGLPAAHTNTAVLRFHPTLMKCYNGGSIKMISFIDAYFLYILTLHRI